SKIDSVLYEQREALSSNLVKLIQSQLDRLKTGILIANVNVQSVQVPEQVQAAFNDAVKAGADRDRLKNEGQAYASDIIPKARGTAARLHEEALGYQQRVVAEADGDGQRFKSVLAAYERAPAVTRDRLYLETMQQIYSNVSKVMVETRSASNLLYLPLDKLLQQAATPASAAAPAAPSSDSAHSVPAATSDSRSREGARSRDREGR
ncbi:MAG TPA: FtsH protease activity modulator HflK, partial [Burkholderiaceae bacterium]|nr:FtsH protease activity modulator HflK [Burkholderiaceae bacterium]